MIHSQQLWALRTTQYVSRLLTEMKNYIFILRGPTYMYVHAHRGLVLTCGRTVI